MNEIYNELKSINSNKSIPLDDSVEKQNCLIRKIINTNKVMIIGYAKMNTKHFKWMFDRLIRLFEELKKS